jgi:phosphoribosylformylglycinamidine cyclo-ligase
MRQTGKKPGGHEMERLDYKKSGVDINAAGELVRRISSIASRTSRPGLLAGVGGFGALFSILPGKWKEPVLVSSADGVGTKLKIAFLTGVHHTVGVDLVAMCANDVVVQGAEPLFFLDYFATGKLDLDVATRVMEGIVEGCSMAGCALIGGETAEMPGMYREGHYDLAGFCVGIVEKASIVDGSGVRPGDVVLGLASSGLHSNGYSLVRKLFLQKLRWKLDRYVPELGKTLGEELLVPTRIYVKALLSIIQKVTVKAMAHITGGGMVENIPRVLPRGCEVVIKRGTWEVPAIFRIIRERGRIEEDEMMRVFNNGIGMILIVHRDSLDRVMGELERLNEKAFLIGEVRATDSRPRVVFVD